jgi:hypothetical protein
MKNYPILIGLAYFCSGHFLMFYQMNGQFMDKLKPLFTKDLFLAVYGACIGLLFVWGTKWMVEGFEGLLWPTRFIGFGVGMIIYALMVAYHFNESLLNIKTMLSLILCVALVSIQVLWKTN